MLFQGDPVIEWQYLKNYQIYYTWMEEYKKFKKY